MAFLYKSKKKKPFLADDEESSEKKPETEKKEDGPDAWAEAAGIKDLAAFKKLVKHCYPGEAEEATEDSED